MTDDTAERQRRLRERREREGLQRLEVYIRSQQADQVRRYAAREGLSMTEAVAQLLAEALKRR